MTKDEVLKLALEALETLERQEFEYKTPSDVLDCLNAITAIKEALANVATNDTSQERVDKTSESVQEPVAWVIESEEYNAEGERPILREIDYYNQVIDQFPAGTKLYTTPPQRTWVGLTEEQIKECFQITPDQYLPWHIYQRIEAKLKEKNT